MKPFLTLLAFTACLLGTSGASPQPQKPEQPKIAKVGVTIHEPNAFNGYTLFSPMNSTKSYLIDMQGRVVKTWEGAGSPAMYASLLPNGNLLRPNVGGPKDKGKDKDKGMGLAGMGGRIQEFNWDGELVWDCKFPGPYTPHHDMIKLPNGNVLAIASSRKTAEEAAAAGSKGNGMMENDSIVEIRPKGKDGAEVVWQWHVWDHLIQDHDAAHANHGKVADHPERIDINFSGGPLVAMGNPKDDKKKDDQKKGDFFVGKGKMGGDWTHFNGVAYNSDLDQIMISVHSFSEFWIIDHGTTTAQAAGHFGGKQGKGGDLLYRWGNPVAYRAGKPADQRLYNQHNAHWIPKGLPGAGHILVFNNGMRRPDGAYSTVDEIVLPLNDKGGYARKPGTPFGPDKALWSYAAANKSDFLSPLISGAQRLPNGNTLICSGVDGRIFEVTAAKKVVWEYVNPVKGGPGGMVIKGPPGGFDPKNFDPKKGKDFDFKKGGPPKDFGGQPMKAMGGGSSLFRANRYGPEYPGLRGRDLTPGKTIEESLPKDKAK